MIYTGDSKSLKIDPYEPCPCGSGKKFKFCCYQRARKERDKGFRQLQYSEGRLNHLMHKTWEDADFKTCLAFDNSECNGDIISAHSLQNNRILNRISKDNHIYQFAHRITKNEPEVYFRKVSKNKASTFFGFCDFHDTELFKPIELVEYKNDLEQNFLFAFRAHAIEYHRKLRKLNHHREVLKTFPHMLLNEEGVYLYRIAQLDVEDCEKNQQTFKKDYLMKDFSNIRTIQRTLDFEISFATCSSFTVRDDLKGNVINDIYSTSEIEMPSIYINIYPVENGTNILLSYHKNDEKKYKEYFDQLEVLDIEDLTKYLNFLIIEYTENVFFNPNFIEKLSRKEKISLLNSFQSSVNFGKKLDLIRANNYYNFNLFNTKIEC